MISTWLVVTIIIVCFLSVALQNYLMARALNQQLKKYEDVVNDNMTNWTNPHDTRSINNRAKRKPIMVNEVRAEETLKREQGWN